MTSSTNFSNWVTFEDDFVVSVPNSSEEVFGNGHTTNEKELDSNKTDLLLDLNNPPVSTIAHFNTTNDFNLNFSFSAICQAKNEAKGLLDLSQPPSTITAVDTTDVSGYSLFSTRNIDPGPEFNSNRFDFPNLDNFPSPKVVTVDTTTDDLLGSSFNGNNEFSLQTSHNPTNPFFNSIHEEVPLSPINPFRSFFENATKEGTCSETLSFVNAEKLTNGNEQVHHTSADSLTDFHRAVPQTELFESFEKIQIPGGEEFEDNVSVPASLDSSDISEQVVDDQAVDGWSLMLRIPEKKTKMSSRQWGPVYVTLSKGCLLIYYDVGLEKPFKKFPLQLGYELSEPRLENFNEMGKIHALRIECVSHREKRRYPSKIPLINTESRTELLKLGTTNYEDFTRFISVFQDEMMTLPTPKDSYSVYAEESLSIEVSDFFRGVLAKDGSSLVKRITTTRIYILAFLSGKPECTLGINDVDMDGKESVRREDIVPNSTEKWIKLFNCKFHSCANVEAFKKTKAISFRPPDACRFELMHFQTDDDEMSLPFTIRPTALVKGAFIDLQCWLVMSTLHLANRDQLRLIPCEAVSVRFPVPDDWIKIFRTETFIKQRSLMARVNRSAKFGSTTATGLERVMRVTIGSAKYEHAFRAIVWRIECLPDKNAATDHPHCLSCRLELGSHLEVPASFLRPVEVEFDMPAASASKTCVRSFAVADSPRAMKHISYFAHYHYEVC
uniref:Stonin-2 n=1 Tax=Eptatretus burgeri TaxID=7764 RepID=A0A8C4WY71_EPTBU